MKRWFGVGIRMAVLGSMAALVGCPGTGPHITFELWIANTTSNSITQVILSNQVTQQADNVITDPILGQTLVRLDLSVLSYGQGDNSVVLVGNGGISEVVNVNNLALSSPHIVAVYEVQSGQFATTTLTLDDRTAAGVLKALIPAADGVSHAT